MSPTPKRSNGGVSLARRSAPSGASLRRALPAFAAMLVASAAGSAVAAPIIDPNDPALGPAPVTIDFEAASPGTYPAYAGGLSVPTTDGIVNFTAPRLQIASTYAGQYNTTGSQYLSSEGYLFRNLIITFPTPVRAFGFNVGLTSQPWEIYAYDASGAPIEMVTIPPILGSNAGDFYGIASTSAVIAQAVLVVQLPLRPGPLWVVVDNVKFGSDRIDPADSADLAVDIGATPGVARVGRRLIYRTTTENHGPATAAGVVLTVTLDGLHGSDLSTVKAPTGCTLAGAIVSCSLGDIAAGRRKRTTISLVAGAPGTLSATAAARSATPDPTPANATVGVTTIVR